MRIKRIAVKNLFGTYNHEVPLRMEDHVTIIHGPNGIGKTILLRMLDGLFNARYNIFQKVPFQEFRVELENDTVLKVMPPSERKKKPTLQIVTEGEETKSISLESLDSEEFEELRYYLLRRGLEELVPVDLNVMDDAAIEEFLSVVPLESFPPRIRKTEENIRNVREEIEPLDVRTRFIQAQRLQRPPVIIDGAYSSFNVRRRTSHESREFSSTVEQHSLDLVNRIDRALTEYANRSQSLDKTFPTRLIEQIRNRIPSDLSSDQVVSKLKKLDEERQELVQAGLLQQQEDITTFDHVEPELLNVLSVYIHDVEDKFTVFEELRDKIGLLTEVINSRFLNKKMHIRQSKGFVFTPTAGTDSNLLSASELSSGEQHQLVLFYELLFRVQSGSLILIDEPELSLHIAWQNQFLTDLERIVKAGDFDVILATHSPDIIGNRWELTVDLAGEGPQE